MIQQGIKNKVLRRFSILFRVSLAFLFSVGLALLPLAGQAARLFFDVKTVQVQAGEKFEVNLFINTEKEDINAIEGKLSFSKDILELKELREGNSIINFWIERPKNQDGAIMFSGITPGGFNIESGFIFSAVFETKEEGVAKFEIKDARVLRNDGEGSMAALSVAPLEMVVSEVVPAGIPEIPKVIDHEQPESFVPKIARDPTLFDGQWFLVFATQDKASGIDHYEVREMRTRLAISLPFMKYLRRYSWISAESPYLLTDQELKSYIYVKAADKVGNERVEIVAPRYPLPWYKNYLIWVIIGILAIFTYFFRLLYVWLKRRI